MNIVQRLLCVAISDVPNVKRRLRDFVASRTAKSRVGGIPQGCAPTRPFARYMKEFAVDAGHPHGGFGASAGPEVQVHSPATQAMPTVEQTVPSGPMLQTRHSSV
jgi:hypothetical protein